MKICRDTTDLDKIE